MASPAHGLAIIGGGAAGLMAAQFAASFGVRVVLVDRQRLGGDCLWTGCVPSKTLLRAAHVADAMRHAARYGLTATEPVIDFQAVMARVRAAQTDIYSDETPESWREKGIDVALGEASFINPQTLRVGDWEISARHYLVASGAVPLVPNIPGLKDTPYLTYETIWDMAELPAHLIVVGGGPIGCEMAQAFRRLGSEVTVIEALDRLLPQDDDDAAATMAEVFRAEGINLALGGAVTLTARVGEEIHVIAGDKEITGSALLMAVGRRPVVQGLGLEKAGIKYGGGGIQTDRFLRTSNRRVYAAGDCRGDRQFTHYAGWQGVVAARNALLPGRDPGVKDTVPWATFTEPEVAQVGLTEAQARKRHGSRVAVQRHPMAKNDRARTDAATTGFVKLVYLDHGRLLGASIVAPRAAEMIQEWVIALARGLKPEAFADVIHVYPSYTTASVQAAYAVRRRNLFQGRFGWLLRRLARAA